MRNEARFRMVEQQDPERYRRAAGAGGAPSAQRDAIYQQLAGVTLASDSTDAAAAPARRPALAAKDE